MEIHEEFSSLMDSVAGDPELRARMRAEPAKVLEEQGISAPPGAEIRVVEDSAEVCHVILPPSPNAMLSDASMEAMAGGIQPPPRPVMVSLPGATSQMFAFTPPAS